MADASGVDLNQFKHWYTQSGTPIINVNESFDVKASEYTLTLAQSNGENPALHIPVGIELIAAKGEQNQSTLLQLTKKEQSWTFKGYSQKPVLALLTDFSAPVRAPFSQPDQDLQIIMTRATDEFCRWDAGQKLLTTYIMQLLHNPALVLPETLYSVFVEILNADISEAFKAEQLTLPSFSELADSIDQVDPIALLNAIENIQYQIANKLAPMLLKQYQQNIQTAYANDGKAIGKRALKNICLSYLTSLNDHQHLVTQQYQSSNNMTDTLATLSCAAKTLMKNKMR